MWFLDQQELHSPDNMDSKMDTLGPEQELYQNWPNAFVDNNVKCCGYNL